MSMRIENGNDLGSVSGARASATQSTGLDAKTDAASSSSAQSADQVNLSSASNFVDLARNLTPADRHARVTSLAAQYNSGTYKPSDSEIGSAIVQSLLQDKAGA